MHLSPGLAAKRIAPRNTYNWAQEVRTHFLGFFTPQLSTDEPMDKFERFLDRAERLMERLERILPKPPASGADWDAAPAFRW